MEIVWSLVLMYLALGAAFFAHPREQAELNDFHWKGQLSIFFDTLPTVLTWPVVVWRLAAARLPG
jgi:hypothetical protein